MKKYILKYTVHNSIEFPAGTTVKLIDSEHYNFVVVKGKLKGKKGCVADGLNGWLFEDTTDNRKSFEQYRKTKKKIEDSLKELNKYWNKLPTASVSKKQDNN